MFITKNCSEATQIENKVDSEIEEFIKMKDEEFMKNSLKNNKLTSRSIERSREILDLLYLYCNKVNGHQTWEEDDSHEKLPPTKLDTV